MPSQEITQGDALSPWPSFPQWCHLAQQQYITAKGPTRTQRPDLHSLSATFTFAHPWTVWIYLSVVLPPVGLCDHPVKLQNIHLEDPACYPSTAVGIFLPPSLLPQPPATPIRSPSLQFCHFRNVMPMESCRVEASEVGFVFHTTEFRCAPSGSLFLLSGIPATLALTTA